MRKIKIYGLLTCVCLMMQSCLFNEDDIFDESSAQRAIASVNECQEILKGAANGWLLEYYTGEDGEYGGFNVLARFDGNNVIMAADFATDNYEIGEESTSLYKVESYQGTELSFDSYNELIHEFCEPSGYNSPGYAGDYEFVFRSVSKEKIVLTGKKHGVTLIMTPLPAETNWQEKLTNIANVVSQASYVTYKLIVNGQEITKMGQEEHAFSVTKVDETGETTVSLYPFIYTEEGIKMYEPLVVNGVEINNFKWDNENLTYICTDTGVDAKIEFYCPEGYLNYLGNYILQLANGQRIQLELKQKMIGKSFAMNFVLSGTPIEFVYNYNMTTDCIDVPSQTVGVYQGYNVLLYPGIPGGNFYADDSAVFQGRIANTDPLTIKFTYVNNPICTLMLLVYQKTDGWYGFSTMFQDVTLIKVD